MIMIKFIYDEKKIVYIEQKMFELNFDIIIKFCFLKKKEKINLHK